VNYNDDVTVFTPQQVAGMFFGKMKELVQTSSGQKAVDMVISVPPYYTDAQRHAVLDACKIGVRRRCELPPLLIDDSFCRALSLSVTCAPPPSLPVIDALGSTL
jgi:hypothetical protein